MDIIVGLFALVIAVGCAIAIVLASRRDNKAEKGC
jgi:ABC-type Fe3+ transport system permease subunit